MPVPIGWMSLDSQNLGVPGVAKISLGGPLHAINLFYWEAMKPDPHDNRYSSWIPRA